MNKPNVLFVTEKYCDGKPEGGLTNNYHNLFGSLKHALLEISFNVVHLDEAVIEHNTHMDTVLPRICSSLKPDICIFSLLGKSSANPNPATFEILKKMGIKNVVMWPDVGIDWGYPQIYSLGDLVDLHVGWDRADSEFHKTRQLPANFIQMWVPQDEKLYYKQEKQDIPISFIGSVRYQDRQMFLSHAFQANVPLMINGGQRQGEGRLSPEQYASLIRRSQIGINFSWSPGSFHQCKGRVYEILASNSMLLESKNEATSQLFKPGIEYVEFENPVDFVEKIKYYTSHPEETKKIADMGYKAYNEKYSAKLFWKTLFDKVK